MLESEYKEVIRKSIEKVPIRRICDICGKEIDQTNWFKMSVCHSDWGNDSIDSFTMFDVCSPTCVLIYSKHYLNDSYESPNNTKEIQIEHMKHSDDSDSDGDGWDETLVKARKEANYPSII